MAEVFASLPATVIGFAMGIGIERAALLDAADLTEAQLADPDGLVPYDSLVGIWSLMQAHFPERALGLEYAAFVPWTVFGEVGYVLTNAPNARALMQAYLRFMRLVDPFLQVEAYEADGQVELRLDTEPRTIALEEPMEMMLASMTRTAIELVATAVTPTQVLIRHARRHALPKYTAAFSAPVAFEAEHYAVRFDAAHLDLPLPGADPALGRYLTAHLTEKLQARDAAAPSFPESVAVELEAGLATGRLTQGDVAAALHVSVRTLQRRLEEAGTRFSAVLDEVRHRRATQLLSAPNRSVAEVAYLLGYTEPRAFHRSFRRWTGQTPSAWRHADGAK